MLQLLQTGYQVRGTVRDVSNESKSAFLRAMPGADERLELVNANLLDAASWTGVIDGCDYVMHVASPYAMTVDDPQRDLVDPAVQGTLNVLRAVDACEPCVTRRVVLTSSYAAVTDEPVTGHIYTEADWNTKSTLHRNPYFYSKAQAERAAWNHVNAPLADGSARTWDLITMNPPAVIGPRLSPGKNPSTDTLLDMLTGNTPAVVDIQFFLADVRDVATAHIAAMTSPVASGRYLLCEHGPALQDVVDYYRELHMEGPGYKLPGMTLTGSFGTCLVKHVFSLTMPSGARTYVKGNVGKHPVLDSTKASKELGWVTTPWQTTVKDMLADAIAAGELPPCPAAHLEDAHTADAADWGRDPQGTCVAMTEDDKQAQAARVAAGVPIPEQ